MYISYLEITNFRNLTRTQVHLSPQFNILYGHNGSGKTSFLEAIHYLARAKSFRTHLANRIIQRDADYLAVFGQLQKESQLIPMGIQRFSHGQQLIHLNKQPIISITEISRTVPLQLIHPESHRLLTDGPKLRRQFIDWGMFHVEPSFLPVWKRAQQAIKQRNAALRALQSEQQIQLWDKELVAAANVLHQLRKNYMTKLIPIAQDMIKIMLDHPIQLRYYPGWPENKGLGQVLQDAFPIDQQFGYTRIGPHRADLKATLHAMPAHDALSQGQQKLLIYALHLAQGQLLSQLLGQTPLYLIDDLPAELDKDKRQIVARILQTLEAQVFITGTELKELQDLLPKKPSVSMFHVEQGRI